jgi:hypothetical protein
MGEQRAVHEVYWPPSVGQCCSEDTLSTFGRGSVMGISASSSALYQTVEVLTNDGTVHLLTWGGSNSTCCTPAVPTDPQYYGNIGIAGPYFVKSNGEIAFDGYVALGEMLRKVKELSSYGHTYDYGR